MSPTVPGDIPGLLRRGSPVQLTVARFHGVVLDDPEDASYAAVCWRSGDYGARRTTDYDRCHLVLDLSDATGRVHAAWWVWLPANSIIPLERLVGEQVDYAAAMGATGLSWCEACYSAGLGTRGEILDAVSFAREGRPMTADQIDRLRRVVLHVAGRPL